MSTNDRLFDDLYPAELRSLSPTQWTPVSVAIRAASLLSASAGTRVLDVGAGSGKLCAIGAMSSSAIWCGVERHEPLVTVARQVVHLLGIADRTMFVHGDAFAIDWRDFHVVYLHNPFELGSPSDRAQVSRAEQRLAALLPGTRVLTYHGFGGVMPSSFELLHHERIAHTGRDLVLWIQHAASRR